MALVDAIPSNLCCNGGVETNRKCAACDLGEHRFSDKSMTNILSPSDVTDKHRAVLDASEEMGVKVHFPKKTANIRELANRLWGVDPTDEKVELGAFELGAFPGAIVQLHTSSHKH